MRNPGDYDKPLLIIDRIDDSMIADSDSEVIMSSQLRNSMRSRLVAQTIDGGLDSLANGSVKPAKRTNRIGMESYFVTRSR